MISIFPMHILILVFAVLSFFMPCNDVRAQGKELADMQAIYKKELARIDDNHLGFLMSLQGDYTNRLNTLERTLTTGVIT